MENIKRNITLLTDYYELLMMEGYFDLAKKNNTKQKIVSFDLFFRKNPYGNGFSVFCGLNEIIDYIENLHFNDDDIDFLKKDKVFSEDFLNYLKDFKFTGSIYSFEEGSVVSPKEPILKIVAPIGEAQLIESAMLCIFNHETLIATKAYRVCTAASPFPVMEFGLRRAMNFDAAIYGAKAACIAGCIGTSNVLSAKDYDIKALGTMAHSWIMSFDDELVAFKEFAKHYPNMAILLVDTYDTLKSGIPNAIKTFDYMKEIGIKSSKYGIRLDSGDLAYLSKEARKMLDDAGYTDAIICASNDLDENVITSLKLQEAKITLFGVGTKLITGDGDTLGGVYKLSSIYDDEIKTFIPKLKISSNAEKITNPGNKEVYRVYDKNNMMIADLIALSDEDVEGLDEITLYDPVNTWRRKTVKRGEYRIERRLKPIFENGKLVYKKKTVAEANNHFMNELDTLYTDNKRLTNPRELYVDLSDKLFDVKKEILNKYS